MTATPGQPPRVTDRTEPVFVIHGVANRDPDAFAATVAGLAGRLGSSWRLMPVFWGDLGADVAAIDLVLPVAGGVRGVEGPEPERDAVARTLLAGGAAAPAAVTVTRAGDPRPTVIAAAAAGTASAPGVRGAATVDWEPVIRDEWPRLTWLPQVYDEELLAAVGRALGDTAGDSGTYPGDPLIVTRGGPAVRSFDDWAKRRLHDLDRVVGAVVGLAAGQLNAYARQQLAPGVGRFTGDVLVYQHRSARIQARVREVIEQHAPGAGTAEHPVRLIGHSLGGVIAVDLAVAGDPPLWTAGLVTFGSQWPLFQVVDPRRPAVAAVDGTPVALPPSLGAWTNLWEPMDPLAFVAGRAFRLASGQAPRDVSAAHLASSGLWTHSAYWGLPELVQAVRDTL